MANILVFATNNAHKLKEIRNIVPGTYQVIGLKDIGCTDDIPETATTLEGNADLKAGYVFKNFGRNCFADDTGLEVDALGGQPGVYSARYAGEDGKQGAACQAEGMKNGQGAEDDILGAEVQPGYQLMAICQNVRVCEHDAFRCAFGTGGEQDDRGLIGVFIWTQESVRQARDLAKEPA